MGITEEQRGRIEANRLAALERRKRLAEAAAAAGGGTDASVGWRLAKCPRFAPPPQPTLPPPPPPPPPPPVGFKVVLEVCSPEDFSVAVGPAEGFAYPSEAECLRAVQDCISSAAAFSTTQSQSGHLFSVFKLMDYELVLKCLKKLPGVAVQDIPYKTRNVIKNLPTFFAESCASDKEVDELLMKLPQRLRDALLPFQLEGVRFGLRRHGRCLIADEMGLDSVSPDAPVYFEIVAEVPQEQEQDSVSPDAPVYFEIVAEVPQEQEQELEYFSDEGCSEE